MFALLKFRKFKMMPAEKKENFMMLTAFEKVKNAENAKMSSVYSYTQSDSDDYINLVFDMDGAY